MESLDIGDAIRVISEKDIEDYKIKGIAPSEKYYRRGGYKDKYFELKKMEIKLMSVYSDQFKRDRWELEKSHHLILVTRYYPRGVAKGKIEYIPDLAPSRELLKLYKNDEISWDKYSKRYKEEILNNKKALEKIDYLVDLYLKGEDIILLCVCRESGFCHRWLLRDIILNRSEEAII